MKKLHYNKETGKITEDVELSKTCVLEHFEYDEVYSDSSVGMHQWIFNYSEGYRVIITQDDLHRVHLDIS